MKYSVIWLACLLPLYASAQLAAVPKPGSNRTQGTPGPSVNQYNQCLNLGRLFEIAARSRDEGKSPQEALVAVGGQSSVSPDQAQTIVNAVYLNPELKPISASAIRSSVVSTCVNRAG